MPAPADEPLSRCDLNLYTKDKAWLFRRYGTGWSVIIRQLVRQHIKDTDKPEVIQWPIK